jgi:hypothetical protein
VPDDGHRRLERAGVYFLSMSGMENHIDRTVPSMPGGDRVRNGPVPAAKPPSAEQRNVMDTLLGKNNLSAVDLSGSDPYNAMGKHFRR